MEVKEKRCHFCNVEVGEDYFCYGCKSYVCDSCDETTPMGDHPVEEHRYDRDSEFVAY